MAMTLHKKKMVAPIVVAVIMVVYCVLYFGLLMWLLNGIWRYALGIVPLAFSGVMIYVCVQRIREIRKGEEDDIGQY